MGRLIHVCSLSERGKNEQERKARSGFQSALYTVQAQAFGRPKGKGLEENWGVGVSGSSTRRVHCSNRRTRGRKCVCVCVRGKGSNGQ